MAVQMAPQAQVQGGAPQRQGAPQGPGMAGGAQGAYGGGSTNPMQPVYTPTVPYGQATYSNYNVSPKATLQQIMAGFLPAQRQATSALNNNLAASGIVGGGGQGAQNLLQGQLSASIAPTLASAIQGAQGMGLQQSQGNQYAANSMTGQNLADYIANNQFNATSANQARQTLAQMLMSGWGTGAGGLSNILGGGQEGANALAGSEANNFPVYQSPTLLGMLGL